MSKFSCATDLKAKTGLDIFIFSDGGELQFSTVPLTFVLPESIVSGSKTKIIQLKDAKITCFYFLNNKLNYICAIMGANSVSLNYANMIKLILESEEHCLAPLLTREQRFRLYLINELDTKSVGILKQEYYGKAFDYYVLSFMTDSEAKLSELKNFLEAIAERDDFVVPINNKSVAYIKKCGMIDEYQSANDFAYTLYDNIKEELRINFVINVGGTTHNFDDLPMLFAQCVFAYSFGKLMSPNENIYSYKEYIMIKMLSDIPKSTLTQYLGTLLDSGSLGIIADDELMSTAEEFLRNSLNISETSRNIYMHRNTLIYRLDKIENATGLNIRHFNDAVIFRLITILNKLTTD